MDSTQAIVLRDSEGNFYLVTQDVLRAARVPEDKVAALQQAVTGEVTGYLFGPSFTSIFSAPTVQNAATNLNQGNTSLGANSLVGGFVIANNQSLSQLGLNVGSVSTNQGRA
jgi:uncharacterized protein YbjQ (UPF0145 family)